MKNFIAAVLTLTLIPTASVFAWDSEGHMQVAEIAWQHLNPSCRTRVAALLQLNPNYSSWILKVTAAKRDQTAFVMAATWPDFIKSAAGYIYDSDVAPPGPASSQNIGYSDKLQHRYWHYIDTPFSTDGTALVQPAAPNAKTQIELFTAAIADSATSDDIKSYDLVWLEHLVGDVHQPLHATSRFAAQSPTGDEGGNLVVLCTNQCKTKSELHAFWDNLPGVSKSAATAIAAANRLPAAPAAEAAVAEDQAWITESFDAAKHTVYASPVGPGTGPYILSTAYKSRAKTEAKARIELAGIRLANLVNKNLT
jgi:hypothetical protein